MPEKSDRGVYPHMLLAAAVLRQASADPDYFLTPCGRFWCDVIGIEIEAAFDLAKSKAEESGKPYKPRDICPGCGSKDYSR